MFARLFIMLLVLAAFIVQSVQSVELLFEGRVPENSRDIKKAVERSPDPSFALLDSIVTDLVSRGYIDAAMEIKSGNIIIRAGSKYFVSKIILIADSIQQSDDIHIPFDSASVSIAINQRLQKFRDQGYLYVSAETKKISIQDSLVLLKLDINMGPLVKIGEQIYAGLSRTGPGIISNYVPNLTGKKVTPALIKQAETAARNVPFLTFKPPLELAPRPGYTVSDIVFNFLEQTPVSFKGAAGIAGEENNTVWSFDLALNNLFGSGKRVEIVSEKRESGRNLLHVQYSQPLFIAGTGKLKFEVLTRNYRDEFYEFDIAAGYATRLNNSFTTSLKLGWKSVIPETGNLNYRAVSGQLAIFKRTQPTSFNPSNGLEVNWAIDFRFRKYTSDNLPEFLKQRSFYETRNNLTVSLFQKFAGPFIWHGKIRYQGLETKEDLPPLSELILIGGPGTLRGYRNEQFAAIRTVYGTIEPRLRFGSGFGFLFYDAAYLNNRMMNQSEKIETVED
ncbi:MAG: BamA/TamA family outer membrane protein, partial [candidate division Zixibacteria bacterium]|nr:BamA/TamA family outer membrane protein [candidate division Zixibacteria bacterium]